MFMMIDELIFRVQSYALLFYPPNFWDKLHRNVTNGTLKLPTKVRILFKIRGVFSEKWGIPLLFRMVRFHSF